MTYVSLGMTELRLVYVFLNSEKNPDITVLLLIFYSTLLHYFQIKESQCANVYQMHILVKFYFGYERFPEKQHCLNSQISLKFGTKLLVYMTKSQFA